LYLNQHQDNTKLNFPEIALLSHQIQAASGNVTISRGYGLPRVDFKSMYGFHDLTYGDTNANGDAWSSGLFFTYPIFDSGKTKGLVIQADSERNSLELDLEKLNDTLILQVRQAVNAVKEAGEIVKALMQRSPRRKNFCSWLKKGINTAR
jgi:outer membrane protein TolC